MKPYFQSCLTAVTASVLLAGGIALADTFNAASPAHVDPITLKHGEILDVGTGKLVNGNDVKEHASAARVIYVADPHDNPEAHAVQLKIIRALNEKFPGKIAVGTEMFRRDSQPQLDDWLADKLSEKEFKNLYCRNWGDWYSGHEPTFNYIKENSIPLIALNATMVTKRAALKGKTHDDDPSIPVLDLADENHKKYNMEIYNQSFAGDSAHNPNPALYYRMMTFWDEAMAQSVADFLDNPANDDKKLVVIAGEGHVIYGFGIPARAAKRHPHDYTIVIPNAYDGTEATETPLTAAAKVAKIPLPPADYTWKIPNVQVPYGQCRKPSAP